MPVRFAYSPLAALLAGILGVALPTGSMAAGRFDGLYQGPVTLAPGSSGSCLWRSPFRLRVVNDSFDQAFGYAHMRGSIGADGAFRASTMVQLQRQVPYRATLSGQASGNTITATYQSQFCTVNFSLRRQ